MILKTLILRDLFLYIFHCGDIDRTYERLKARGCAIEPPQTQFYGGREMTLTDPDGNVLLFLS